MNSSTFSCGAQNIHRTVRTSYMMNVSKKVV